MNPHDHAPPADADAPEETLYQGCWLSLRRRGRWEYAERNNHGGAAIVIAVTPDDRVLFVEQYRVAIQARTVEMPAGLVGDIKGQEDEGMLLAAQRELEEETGWRCGRVAFLHQGPSSAGMSTEMIAYVRAFDLAKVGAGGGDDSEDIVVHEVPRGEAGAWLRVLLPRVQGGQLLADHLERQVPVALAAQHVAQALDVGRRVLPVARGRAQRRDEPLLLPEPQLRRGDRRELDLQRRQDVGDAHRRAPRDAPRPGFGGRPLVGRPRGRRGALRLPPPRGGAARGSAAHADAPSRWGLGWNVIRNLPICTSSPECSTAWSIRCRLT